MNKHQRKAVMEFVRRSSSIRYLVLNASTEVPIFEVTIPLNGDSATVKHLATAATLYHSESPEFLDIEVDGISLKHVRDPRARLRVRDTRSGWKAQFICIKSFVLHLCSNEYVVSTDSLDVFAEFMRRVKRTNAHTFNIELMSPSHTYALVAYSADAATKFYRSGTRIVSEVLPMVRTGNSITFGTDSCDVSAGKLNDKH